MDRNATDQDDLPPRIPGAAERVLLVVSIAALALVCATVTYTVLARVLNGPLIPDDVQIVRQLMIVVIVFPMAAVTALRMHIAVTVFSNRMSANQKRAMTVFGNAVGFLFTSALLAGAIGLFIDSFESGEYFDGDIRIPYWIAHGAYAVALAALWLRVAAMTCADVVAVRALGKSR